MREHVSEGTQPAAVLADCRERIDRIDGVLLALLRERMLTAVEAAEAKAALGQPVLAPTREAEVLARISALASGPLHPTAAARIFEAIIEETRSAEEQLSPKSTADCGRRIPA